MLCPHVLTPAPGTGEQAYGSYSAGEEAEACSGSLDRSPAEAQLQPQSSRQLHLIPTPQLVKQNPHPGLGAGFRPAFEVEPNGVTGAASWDAFCRRGLCPSSSPSSRADSYNHHQRPRPPRVTEPRCPQGCLPVKQKAPRALPGHHTSHSPGGTAAIPAGEEAGRPQLPQEQPALGPLNPAPAKW